MRSVLPNATSQTIQFDAFDANGQAVVLAYNSSGLAISVATTVNGRTTYSGLTLVARDSSGVWKSSAIENIGGTEVHEVDVPNSFFAIDSGVVSLKIVSPDVIAAPAESVEMNNLAAELVAAVGSGISVVSPLSQDGGTLRFTQGDDLYTGDGKAPVWTLTGSFPSWVGATGELRLTCGGITKTVAITDAQIQDTGSTRTITAEIPRNVTSVLGYGTGSFQIMIQLASGHEFTEVKNGVLVVQQRIA